MNTQDTDIANHERLLYEIYVSGFQTCAPVQRYECTEYKSKLQLARDRHGKPFAFESGASWKPRSVPLLTVWLQGRGRDVK
jgi:hypothetical protein